MNNSSACRIGMWEGNQLKTVECSLHGSPAREREKKGWMLMNTDGATDFVPEKNRFPKPCTLGYKFVIYYAFLRCFSDITKSAKPCFYKALRF